MTLDNFLAGINILRKYYDQPNWFHLAAEHDQIFMAETDKYIHYEDVATLHKLGWFQEGVEEPEYNLSEPWTTYV